MPREICHLRLRVEDVSVERLQEISAADAYDEGIRPDPTWDTDNPFAVETKQKMLADFRDVWNDIHGDGAWDDNPWVWCVAFSIADYHVNA